MWTSRPTAAALCAALLLLATAQNADAIISSLAEIRADAATDGITSIEELDAQTPAERLFRFGIGGVQYLRSGSPCRSSTLGIVTGCAPQFTYLAANFGTVGPGRIFGDHVGEGMTREFLEGMPLPPNGLCCRSAITFQSNFCACNPDVVLAFRNMGFFDPMQTLEFADFLYGEQCGAVTFLADDCPNGSPFETIGGRRLRFF